MLDECAAALYEEEVGEIRNLPEDHPHTWQWLYRGAFSATDREKLLDLIQSAAEAEAEGEQLELVFESEPLLG